MRTKMKNQMSSGSRVQTRTNRFRPAGFDAGFTLIEVLVVVAIIALLVAILMPSLAAARAQTKTLLCLNNLNHFGKSANMYAHDHKGYIPRDYFPSEYDSRNDSGHGLPHVLAPEVMSQYLGGPKYPLIPFSQDPHNATRDKRLAPVFARIPTLQCPVFPTGGDTGATDHQGKPILEQPYDYVVSAFSFEEERQHKQGSNQYFDSVGVTLVSRIPNPGRLIYVTEAAYDNPYDEFGYHDVFRPEHLWLRAQDLRMSNDYRHATAGSKETRTAAQLPQASKGTATTVSFDGHGERMMFIQMTINRFTPNYTNRDVPLPQGIGG